MPEEEFLSKFQGKIIEKNKENYYIIRDSNGIEQGVSFLDGYLE